MKELLILAIKELARQTPQKTYTTKDVYNLAKAINNLTEALATVCYMEEKGKLE